MDNYIINRIFKMLFSAFISGLLTAIILFFLVFQVISLNSFLAGFTIGFVIYLIIALYLNFVYERFMKRWSLLLILVLNSLVHVLIIGLVASISIVFFYMEGDFESFFNNAPSIFRSKEFLYGIIFGLLMSLFFNFWNIINQLVGNKVLFRLFSGYYLKPKKEDRIFMFLDLKSSTTIAEKTSLTKYLSLLNEFFNDMSHPVAKTKGEIYKYVGDQAIVTWRMKSGLLNANCIRCFYHIDSIIANKKQYYINKFGIVPEFKAGIHGGRVVAGEMGYFKKEVAYLGDVLNTAARIEAECNVLNERLLVSDEVVERIKIPREFSALNLGEIQLRGKKHKTTLYSVGKKNKRNTMAN